MFVDIATIGYSLDDSQFAAGAKRVVSAFKEILDKGQKSEKQVDRLRDELGRFTKGPAASASFGSFFKGWEGGLNKTIGLARSLYVQLAALAALAGGAGLFAAFVKQGIDFNSQIQTSKLGIASLIATLGELRNQAGVKLVGVEALMAAIPLANDQIRKLRIAGLETAATTRELIQGFQTAIGPGLAAGLKLDEVRQLTVDLTQAATALGVPLQELGQEVRAILSGDINSDARVAKALGLTNQMVKNWREQNKLAEELNKRLVVFRSSGSEIAKTFAGVTSNFKEALEVISGDSTTKATDQIASRLDKVTKSLVDTKNLGLTPEIAKLAAVIDRNLVKATDKFFNLVDMVVEKLKELGRRESEIDAIGSAFGAATDQAGEFARLLYSLVSNGGTINGLKLIEGAVQSVGFSFAILQDTVEGFGRIALAVLENLSYGITRGLQWTLDKLGISFQGLNDEVTRISGNIDELEKRRQQGFFKNTREFASELDARREALERERIERDAQSKYGHLFGVDSGKTGAGATTNPPPKSTGGKGDALREARALAEARLSLARSLRDNELKLLQDSLKREQDTLESAYQDQLLSAGDYYRNRSALQEKGLKAELSNLALLAIETQKQVEQAKMGSAERIRLEERLNDVLTQQALQWRRLGEVQLDVLRDLQREVQKGQAELEKARKDFGSDAKLSGDLESVVDPRIFRGQQAEALYGARDTRLRQDELRIQQQLEVGLISEAEARRQLLGVQRAARDELIKYLQLQRTGELAKGAEASIERVAAYALEIEKLRTLGAELNNSGRFLKGLGDEFTTGDFYEGLGTGLRDTIAQGFADGFEGAALSFSRLLKRLAAELLTSQLIKMLRNLFNPGSTTTTGASGSLQGQGASGGGYASTAANILTGGGGYGGFTTPSYSGGAIPGVSGSGGGGVAGNGGFNLVGFLRRIPGIGRFFGARTAGGGTYAGTATGALGDLPRLPGVSVPPIGGGVAGSATGGLTASLGGLGASGILLGGGLLGQKAGGSSQIGQLLGGLGGTLGAGALAGALGGTAAGAGIFGGAFGAALPALFSNPITAVVAGALIGGALLFNYFGGKDFRKFKKTVKDEYEIAVDGKGGKAVYEQVKQLGEELYGKGGFKNNMLGTIRNDQAKEVLGAYAESTGQINSKLVKQLREARELQDPFNTANRFVRRQHGGAVSAGDSVFDGIRAFNPNTEIFVPRSNGHVFPGLDTFFDRMAANMGNRSSGGRAPVNERLLLAVVAELREVVSAIESHPQGFVWMNGAKEAGREGAQVVKEQFRANPDVKRDFLKEQL